MKHNIVEIAKSIMESKYYLEYSFNGELWHVYLSFGGEMEFDSPSDAREFSKTIDITPIKLFRVAKRSIVQEWSAEN